MSELDDYYAWEAEQQRLFDAPLKRERKPPQPTESERSFARMGKAEREAMTLEWLSRKRRSK